MQKVDQLSGDMQQFAQIDATKVQIQRVDQDATVGTVCGTDDVERLIKGAQAREGWKLQINCQAKARSEVAGFPVNIDQKVTVVAGLRPGGHDHVLGADFTTQFQGPLKTARVNIFGDTG